MALYWPLADKEFASDDFKVLRRVVFAPHGILIKGFFRPLSDISLYLNYGLAGFHPVGYNLFNFICHACIVYIVFLTAKRIAWIPAEKKPFFSWLSALLFLTYPFHNETVVWTVCRGTLLASLFALLAMLTSLSSIRPVWKYLLVCVFYFTGMGGYESIVILPGIILLLVYDRSLPLRSYRPWILWMGFTLGLHICVRVLVSGVLFGWYVEHSVFYPGQSYPLKWLKTAGRTLLPPMEHPAFFIVLFVLLALVLFFCMAVLWRKRNKGDKRFNHAVRFAAMALLAMLIPLMFGISTRTYEGDRLFYFPSIFISLWLAWLVTALLPANRGLMAGTALLAYQCVFLFVNISNWHKASSITEQITGAIKAQLRPGRRMLVVNVPQEYNGAHVLRNGFYDALWWNGVDTGQVRVVNYVTTEQMRELPDIVRTVYENDHWFIAPATSIRAADTIATDILYWNKEKLIRLH